MLDFMKLAEEHRIPTLLSGHHHCVEGWVQTHCPFCASGGSGWHLGFNLQKGYFSCWRCGKLKSNDVLSRLVPGTPLRELYGRFLAGRRGPSVAVARRKGQASRVVYPPDVGPLSARQRAYLRKRGFEPTEIEATWGVRGVGPCGGEWAHRILIPIHDPQGKVVSFTARAIADVEPKYRNLSVEKSVVNPKSLLYGLHLVPGDDIMVVEGPLDAWRLGPGTVALMGAAWTPEQVEGLRSFKRIVLIPDCDGPGLECMDRLANWLASSDASVEIAITHFSDPGAMSNEAAECLKRELWQSQ